MRWEELTTDKQNFYINAARYLMENHYVRKQNVNILGRKIFEKRFKLGLAHNDFQKDKI